MTEPIRQEVVLPATPARLYAAYMDSAEHEAFTRNGSASISEDAGGAFSCHGGAILGRNVELVPGKRIVQAWRVANWPAGVYSLVRIDLEPAGTQTRVKLTHDAIPEGERDHLDSGWHARYWDPLRAYFSEGARVSGQPSREARL
jgi:activator of HSP90 ATPase